MFQIIIMVWYHLPHILASIDRQLTEFWNTASEDDKGAELYCINSVQKRKERKTCRMHLRTCLMKLTEAEDGVLQEALMQQQ